ncbi:hypothetical protein [Pseudomonas sp. Snoq117.2]|uniref:phage baseplate plug family protein n=1 Tax=Pseudomonas sp. Snoq117.2 TaxID=1500302 RepID=UPI0008D69BF0|nr:hypothetical protein [Pseudomonas sp. Snoq117.2]SEP41568.1 hypothetical protein SAMN02787149_1116 [Pseudomonas sp. Snoq117.2]
MSIVFQEIPLKTDAYYEQLVTLQGTLYVLTFIYSSYYGKWHMNLKTSTGTEIAMGIGLVPSYPMLLDYALEHHGITGAFWLLPITPESNSADNRPGSLQYALPDTTQDVRALATYYQLFYAYDDEEDG